MAGDLSIYMSVEATDSAADRKRQGAFAVLLLATVILSYVAYSLGDYESLLITIPILIIVLYALHNHTASGVVFPPLMIALIVAIMALLIIGRAYQNISTVAVTATDFVLGVFLDLVGLIIIYSMLKASPGFDQERPFFITLTAFCIAVSLFSLVMVGKYSLEMLSPRSGPGTLGRFMSEIVAVILGAFAVSVLFYLNRHGGLFKHTVDRFLRENAEGLGLADREREAVMKEIDAGESSKLEFKSSLRTNLKTGEKDPRLERAVLKTIVAFLNSKGGTLLVGVADDGTIIGADVTSFENSRDKLLLHFNNLITSQIGSEYLPYVSYSLIDCCGKSVLRVVCKRCDSPVFLNEGRDMTFFVRSGPSSIDLHGMDLLYYANRNFGRMLKRPQRPGNGGR